MTSYCIAMQWLSTVLFCRKAHLRPSIKRCVLLVISIVVLTVLWTVVATVRPKPSFSKVDQGVLLFSTPKRELRHSSFHSEGVGEISLVKRNLGGKVNERKKGNHVIDNDIHLGRKFNNQLQSLRQRFPSVFIIGFGKAGTRALFEVLKLRPDLDGPREEKRFFSRHFKIGLRRYLTSLPEPPVGGSLIEKSPDYITDHSVATRLKASALKLNVKLENLKFIVMLRDPIDRAMSEYLEWNVSRHLKSKDRLPSFHSMIIHANGSINDNQPFMINYAKHIVKWLKYFNKNQTCFVDGDGFVKDPYSEVHLLEKCLGMEPYFTLDNFVYKPEKGFYCFKSSINQTGVLCMGSRKGRRHPKIPEVVYRKLRDYFRPMNSQLLSLVDRVMEWQKS